MANRLPLVRVGGKNVQIPVGDGLRVRGAINQAEYVATPADSAVELGNVTSDTIRIDPGSGTINSFTGGVPGMRRVLYFNGAITLVNSSNLNLPGSADIVTATRDFCEIECLSVGEWQVIWYQRRSGAALVSTGGTGDFKKDGSVQMTGPLNEAVPASSAPNGSFKLVLTGITSNTILVPGTVTGQPAVVNGIEQAPAGAVRRLRFTAAMTLLNVASSFEIFTGDQIVTVAGDTAEFVSLSSSTPSWRMTSYQKADGTALISSSGPTDTDGLPEGSTNKYFTAARVLATVLAGFATSVGAVTAADTILAALGKLEGTKAPLASPTFTGTPAAPTAAAGTSTTQLATTAFASNAATTAGNAAAAASVPTSSVGAANGVAPLGSDSKIAAAYLPSYVDDVLEFANLAAFPATGETGKIYIALDTNREYRWSGSTYIQLVASPGTTDNVPEGTTNLYFTVARVLATALSGLSLVTGSAVVATDSILVAIGKLQTQNTAQDTAIAGKEPSITAAASTTYWNGLKSFVDFATSVRAAVLTGLSLATRTPVTAADSVLTAIGKLQAQLTAYGGVFRTETITTSTVGQTSYAVPNGYTVGSIIVFFNGVLMAPADTTATDGANVVLASGALSTSDIMSVVVIGAVRAQDDALLSYTVATLPAASANTAKLRYCTNMAGGAGPVFSNGTNWLRVADNTVVTT